MQFSVRNCKFQTAEIMGAQSFNFVAKFPPKGLFNFTFSISRRTFFD